MQAHNETTNNPKNTKEVTKPTSVSGYGNLNDWKYTKLNIGIFGDVNDDLKQILIDKLTSYGPQALSLDIRYKIFEHRNNSRLQVWDLNPDKEINQTNFDYFLSQNNLDSFDILILFRKDTFTDFDQEISDYLKSKGFTVLLVGVKENVDIKISPRIHQKVYIISKDELDKLSQDIYENLSDEKLEAFVLSIDPLSKEIIQKKTEILIKRSTTVSAKSSLFGSLISGPGFAIIADIFILSTEIWFYRKQLGLTDENLEKISKNTRSAYEKFMDSVTKNKYGTYVFLKDINAISSALIRTIPTIIASDVFETLKFLPVVGTVLHGTVSIAASKSTLIQILDELSKLAINVQQLTNPNKQQIYRNDQSRAYQSIRY